jgi:predicted Zn-dependent protease
VSKGKIVARIDKNDLQYGTRKLWNSVLAIGDATTVRSGESQLNVGTGWGRVASSVTAPAVAFKEIDVITAKSPF